MKNYQFKIWQLLFLLFPFFVVSCDDDDDNTPFVREELTTTQEVNNFIDVAMNDVYLWNNELPDINPLNESNSFDYFEKLKHDDDRWSWLTDDVEALEASFAGTETTFGYSLAFTRFYDSNDVFATVEYVYPNSPASEAGIQRGDIITGYNGITLNITNYTELIYASQLNVELAELNGKTITSTGETKSITAREMDLDPANAVSERIIERGEKKIAYLFYAQYIGNFNSSLDTKFANFISEGVTDLVLDLRYNPGGGVDAARHLCSMIAPSETVNGKEILVTYNWNSDYQAYWQLQGRTDQLEERFDADVTSKMDLNQVYILTGSGSASASELTITGLRPYMNVTTIGDTTHGKYAASITIKPQDIYTNSSDYAPIDNWAIQPIVIKYANSQGVTDFKDGFAPDYIVTDDIYSGIPLGDENEPLLAKAISLITDTPVASLKTSHSFKAFDRRSSRFDKQKKVLNIGSLNK